jgi:hypothetical protein
MQTSALSVAVSGARTVAGVADTAPAGRRLTCSLDRRVTCSLDRRVLHRGRRDVVVTRAHDLARSRARPNVARETSSTSVWLDATPLPRSDDVATSWLETTSRRHNVAMCSAKTTSRRRDHSRGIASGLNRGQAAHGHLATSHAAYVPDHGPERPADLAHPSICDALVKSCCSYSRAVARIGVGLRYLAQCPGGAPTSVRH